MLKASSRLLTFQNFGFFLVPLLAEWQNPVTAPTRTPISQDYEKRANSSKQRMNSLNVRVGRLLAVF
ncbi:hypothetical protein EBR03_03870 [bacterium]|nr:hypothetical protein [bacterium]